MSPLWPALILAVVVAVIATGFAFAESLDNAETGKSSPAENVSLVVASMSILIAAGIVGALIRQHLYS